MFFLISFNFENQQKQTGSCFLPLPTVGSLSMSCSVTGWNSSTHFKAEFSLKEDLRSDLHRLTTLKHQLLPLAPAKERYAELHMKYRHFKVLMLHTTNLWEHDATLIFNKSLISYLLCGKNPALAILHNFTCEQQPVRSRTSKTELHLNYRHLRFSSKSSRPQPSKTLTLTL